MTDLTRDYEQLRAETAAMFAFDPTTLSTLQTLQIDLVSLLRLEVDALQGTALAGGTPDLARLSAAVTLLQKLVPPRALEAAPPRSDEPDAVAKLQALITGYIVAADEEMQIAETLKIENEALRAELEKLKFPGTAATPAPSPPPTPPPPSQPRLATTDGAPVAPEPPKRDTNNRSAQPPAHFLKSGQPVDPGIAYVNPGGSISRGGDYWGPI